jgi:plastocyanin domain-containing protein
MFWIIMGSLAGVIAIGWIGYGVWWYLEYKREKSRPKPTTEHLKQVRSSFDEYIKKMEKFEKKVYKREELE